MIGDRYYYSKLPESEKRVYREIYQGCMEHRDIIQISDSGDIMKSYPRIIHALMDDNPLLYFLNQSTIEIAKDAYGNIAVLPQYFFSAEKVTAYNQRLQDAANRIIYDLGLTEGSDLEKVRKVHDHLCSTVSYDFKGSDIQDVTRFITAHNVLGVFAHKKAQCEGIAKAAKVLLNAVDVRCIIVFGQAEDKTGAMADHCWNIVNIEGHPYHMDVTFDIGNGTEGCIAYDYYNITDSQIRKDHVFSTGLPKCTDKQANYFELEGLSFSSRRKLENYISSQVKGGSRVVYFKLTGNLKANGIGNELMYYAERIISESGIAHSTAALSINEAANTCRIILT